MENDDILGQRKPVHAYNLNFMWTPEGLLKGEFSIWGGEVCGGVGELTCAFR